MNLYAQTPKIVAETFADQLWNKKNIQAIEMFMDEKVIIHSLLGDYHGHQEMKTVAKSWLKGFPDLEVVHEVVIGEEDRVCIQWKATGRHLGEFKGKAATEHTVNYSGVTLYRISNDKIIEYWAYIDMQHLLSQISKG